MRFLAFILTLIVGMFSQTGTSFAYQVPSFTSCVNPQGEVKANYETGIHGIAGKTEVFEGKDTVYSLSENTLTQCFCPVNGLGIQTNWWKAAALSESEITILKSQGWHYIPNGALWGLESAPYLALNSDFSCKNSSGGAGSPQSSNSNFGGAGSSSGQGSAGGAVSSPPRVGQVLGLASAGNTTFLIGVSLIATFALLLGLTLKNRSKKVSK